MRIDTYWVGDRTFSDEDEAFDFAKANQVKEIVLVTTFYFPGTWEVESEVCETFHLK